VWVSWLRLTALAVLEFVWTAKIVLVLLAFFNFAIFVDPRSPGGLKVALPLLTWGLVIVFRRFTVPPRAPAPETDGVSVTASESPALWSLVRQVRASVRGPRVHRVVVGHGAELSLRLERRRWRLGHRRVLGVGFALIAACSPAELAALVGLALRYGRTTETRLTGALGRLAEAYAYRLEVAERSGARTFLSRPFHRWFTPRFNDEFGRLMTARLLRADQAAGKAAGPQVLARALLKDRVVDAFLEEEFWTSVWSHVASVAKPPDDVHTVMSNLVSRLDEHPACSRWMTDWFEIESAYSPSLRRRLDALGETDDLLDPQTIFGETTPAIPSRELDHIALRLSERWALTVDEEWRVQRGEHELALAEFERLAAAEGTGDLAGESLVSYATLTERFKGAEEARELYERAVVLQPEDAAAQFYVGRLRLATGDESGLEFLERAIALDPEALAPACNVAEQCLRAMGRPQDADAYAARAAIYSECRVEAEWAASTLNKSDSFEPHGLDEAAVAAIRDRARQLRDVDAIFLARKPLPGFEGEFRHIALALRRRPTFGLERRDADRRLAVAVDASVPFPEGTTVYATTIDGDDVWLRFRNVPGAEVYHRSWRSTVKWTKLLFIAGALAVFASAWTGEAVDQPAVSGFVFFFVLASVSIGLYLRETRRPGRQEAGNTNK
jgi:tetratricopeptide (TPR) repeat protein